MAILTLKRQAGILYNHQQAINRGDRTLDNVYNSYSWRKASSFEEIRQKMRELDGRELAIISHNSEVYTCGFYYDTVDEETGELTSTRFYYFAPSFSESFEVQRYV